MSKPPSSYPGISSWRVQWLGHPYLTHKGLFHSCTHQRTFKTYDDALDFVKENRDGDPAMTNIIILEVREAIAWDRDFDLDDDNAQVFID